MPVQRFLPSIDRTRLGAGRTLIAISVLPFALVVWSVVAMGKIEEASIFFSVFFGGPLALGLLLALWPKTYLELDLEGRRYSVIRKGQTTASGAIDSLGPLEVRKRTRVEGRGSKRRTIIEYVVIGAVQSEIDLYVMKSAGKARQKMEDLARAWNLPARSLGGAVRAPGALDIPLHERLRGDGAARKPAALAPGWGVSIEHLSPGYAVVSTYRSYEPLTTVGAILIMAVIVLWVPLSDFSFLKQLADGGRAGDPLALMFGAIAVVGCLVALRVVLMNLRDTFFPGTVRITDAGVSYRGRSMRFGQIEEVTATSPIEIVGDRRILTLAGTFCPVAAAAGVAHELQRLILDVAATSPDQS